MWQRTAFGVALVVALTAVAAADGVRDAGSKIRGDYWGGNTGWRSASPNVVYMSPAPITAPAPIVNVAPPAAPVITAPAPAMAPPMTAQSQAERRSFSYQPQPTQSFAPAPMRAPARAPQYLLPKTDPRKYEVR